MKVINKVTAALSMLFAIGLVTTGCSTATENATGTLSGSLAPVPLEQKTKISVGMSSPSEAFIALFLADKAGEFAKENIEIEFVTLTATDSIPALIDGTIDVAATSFGAGFLNAVDQGANLKMVYQGGVNPDAAGLWVRKELVAGLPESLRGVTIGTAYGWAQPSMLMVKKYLEANGMTMADVKTESLPTPEIAPALDAEAFGAAWLVSPSHRIFLESGDAEWVVGYDNNQFSTGYIFGPNLLTEKPEVGQAFVRALMRTTNTYLQGDYKFDDTNNQLIAEAMGLTVEELQYTESVPLNFYSTDEMNGDATSLFVESQEMWIEIGDLLSYDEVMPTANYIDWSFVQRILDENNL